MSNNGNIHSLVIAVLALQGAFAEHEQMLRKLGVETFEIRNRADWDKPKDGLIIPGGESTTMTRIMHDLDLWEPIKEAINNGLPVFGTCAGLIMLDSNHLGTMDITARRNAYGRQLGSFYHDGEFMGITDAKLEGDDDSSSLTPHATLPMTFIRAPYIETAGEDVEILATVDGKDVAARQGNQLVTAFHPELNDDTRIHEYFVKCIINYA
ncbi:MAG: pyridoxal 5'-phosphate synthase glutaminase subunit PdxT [Bacteroidaceae bacterium]|nr:pyridoxal 5'-phosphate synthase glutaminase subunit PdxT [Bacteroidaceae bacterium]